MKNYIINDKKTDNPTRETAGKKDLNMHLNITINIKKEGIQCHCL